MGEAPARSALLTDLYELTMAYAYWRSGKAAVEAAFHLTFREAPFGGGFAVACGLAQAVDYLEHLRFTSDDLAYLASLTGTDGRPLFERGFLSWLRDTGWTWDVDAAPEGSLVFPREPIVRVSGPIAQCQLVETALLNIVNFQTLIATKAARVCLAAEGDPVVEFGLRRAQGPDGGVSASRAAFVGGCAATSDVVAGKLYGIPVKGTHAHSWVMAFDSEEEAFDAWAAAQPNNATFLIDTYDTLEGARRAVEAGRRLRERGHEMIGVRIDSGDLARLSRRVRGVLDEGGFPEARIMASGDLDEHVIRDLKAQGARIDTWGVGTRLASAEGQSALGGVYKLSAVREPGGRWEPRLKVTEAAVKVSDPGVLGVRRYARDGIFAGDVVYDSGSPPSGEVKMISPIDPASRATFEAGQPSEELLVPVFRGGLCVYGVPGAALARERALEQLSRLDSAVRSLVEPHAYPVGLEEGLYELRSRLIREAGGRESG